jgi:hypothetical protein
MGENFLIYHGYLNHYIDGHTRSWTLRDCKDMNLTILSLTEMVIILSWQKYRKVIMTDSSLDIHYAFDFWRSEKRYGQTKICFKILNPYETYRPVAWHIVTQIYSVSTKSLRGFEKLWRANKLSMQPHAVCGRLQWNSGSFLCRQQMA